jgi:hypothetical protein
MDNDPKLRIYPTMVIGLGGAGNNVVRLVKRRYLRTWNSNVRRRREAAQRLQMPTASLGDLNDLPPLLQLLAVDTEPNTPQLGDEPLHYDEYAFLGNFDATKLVTHKHRHRWLQPWWRWLDSEIAPGYVHTGAKQMRPIGRLAFFRNYVTFKEMLQRKLKAMPSITGKEVAEENFVAVTNTPRVIYIVSSVCGGTGAGMLIDAAHVVRHYATDKNSGGERVTIIGILLMPSVFETLGTRMSALQRSRIQANAYAVLKELNHYQVTQKFQALYPIEPVPIPVNPHKAFDYIYLLESEDERGFSLADKSDAEHMAAHLIALTTFSTLNVKVRARDDNIARTPIIVTADTRFQTRSFAYSTFGLSGLVMPRAALWRYFVAETTRWALLRLMPRPTAEGTIMGFTTRERALEEDRTVRWQNYHNQFVSALKEKFEALTTKKTHDELDDLGVEIDKSEGRWNQFEAVLDDMVKRYVLDLQGTELKSGLAGLRGVLDWIAADEASAQPGALGRQKAPPIGVVKQPGALNSIGSAVSGVLGPFIPGDVIKRQRRAREEYDQYEKKSKLWQGVVKKLQDRAKRWISQIDAWENEAKTILPNLVEEINLMAMEIDPTLDTGDTETSTYYALETGAVSLDHLPVFREISYKLLDGSVIEQLLPTLHKYMLAKLTGGLTDYQAVEDLVSGTLKNLEGLREKVYREFDLRFLIYMQEDRSLPTNYRPQQFFERSAAHAVLDKDTNDNDGGKIESNLFLSLPRRLRTMVGDSIGSLGGTKQTTGGASVNGKSASQNGNGRASRMEAMQSPEERNFRHAMQEREHVEVVEGAEDERIDAVRLTHGLPLAHLGSLRHLYDEYRGPRAQPGESQTELDAIRDFTPRMLHLDPEWAVTIPEVYIDPSVAAQTIYGRPRGPKVGEEQAPAGVSMGGGQSSNGGQDPQHNGAGEGEEQPPPNSI